MSDHECKRLASVNAKCSDMCCYTSEDLTTEDDYVPSGRGIDGDGKGYGDYIIFDYCLDCGRIQGKFPIKKAKKQKKGRAA